VAAAWNGTGRQVADCVAVTSKATVIGSKGKVTGTTVGTCVPTPEPAMSHRLALHVATHTRVFTVASHAAISVQRGGKTVAARAPGLAVIHGRVIEVAA
jgi:hypothetical protein